MDCPDKNKVAHAFIESLVLSERLTIEEQIILGAISFQSIEAYEAANKPNIDYLEKELDKYTKIKDLLFAKIDRINMENCDFKLQIEHLLRVNEKYSARFNFVSDQLKGEQNENARFKAENERLREALKPFAESSKVIGSNFKPTIYGKDLIKAAETLEGK